MHHDESHFARARSGLEAATPEQLSTSERYSRQIQLEILGQNIPAAISLVHRAMEEVHQRGASQFFRRPLSEILEVKMANSLENCTGAITIGDVLKLSQSELLLISGFGPASLTGLYAAITKAALEYIEFLERKASGLTK